MPQRPPSLAERLRAAWAHASEVRAPSPANPADTASARQPGSQASSDPGRQFADRLRAAVLPRP